MKNERILQEASRAHKSGNIDLAISLYRQAIDSYPSLAKSIQRSILLAERKSKTTAFAKQQVDIVIPVYNAPLDTQRCIESILSAANHNTFQIIIVNDGSSPATSCMLRAYASKYNEKIRLIENNENIGYTKSVNAGKKSTSSEYVAILNSDTIVFDHWIDGLVQCAESDAKIGIVGALSNAASWQSVPEVFDRNGNFSANPLADLSLAPQFAQKVATISEKLYPRLALANGFCYLIRRKLIDSIGFLDEEAFPVGYGEENDYCLRARAAGFCVALADDVYVYHSKSKSFGSERKKTLSSSGREALLSKYGKALIDESIRLLKDSPELERIRNNCQEKVFKVMNEKRQDQKKFKLIFLLLTKGGGGGAHSVIQEVTGMRRLGIDAKVAIKEEHTDLYVENYPHLKVCDFLIPVAPDNVYETCSQFDVVVATIYQSVKLANGLNRKFPWILPAYYAQDYEPFFHDENTSNWREAKDSYELNNDMVIFAKTDWIRDIIGKNHGVVVHKVMASIDHSTYYPDLGGCLGEYRLCAMIRPHTPRRGAERTMQCLKLVKSKLRDKIQIDVFGCSDIEIAALESDFEFTNHGVLNREKVASLLRSSTIFVDLSDYQAFGRTGLEAMACACIPILPKEGGCHEYAIHGANSYIVDPIDYESVAYLVIEAVADIAKIASMRLNALETASRFSVHNAAATIYRLLLSNYLEHSKANARPAPIDIEIFSEHGDICKDNSFVLEYIHEGCLDACNGGTLSHKLFANKQANSKLCEIRFFDPSMPRDSYLSQDGNELALTKQIFFHKIDCRHIYCDIDSSRVGVNSTEGLDDLAGPDASCVSTEQLSNADNFVFNFENWMLGKNRNYNKKYFHGRDGKLRIALLGCYLDRPVVDPLLERLNRINDSRDLGICCDAIGVYQTSSSSSHCNKIYLPKKRDFFSFRQWLMFRNEWQAGVIFPSPYDESMFSARYRLCQFASLGVLPVIHKEAKTFSFIKHRYNALIYDGSDDSLAECLGFLADTQMCQELVENLFHELTSSEMIVSPGKLINSLMTKT